MNTMIEFLNKIVNSDSVSLNTSLELDLAEPVVQGGLGLVPSN